MAIDTGIQFHVAECIGGYDGTYKRTTGPDEPDNVNNLYTTLLEIYSSDSDTNRVYAKPYSLNGPVQVPVCGEHVIVFKSYSADNNSDTGVIQWYYIPMPIALSSGINNNMLPGISSEENQADENHVDKSISPLQNFPGDVTIQGRWGNSIRFGSTTTNQDISVNSTWVEGDNGDPIIILSNTKTNKPDKEFVVEDITSDYSSLWLTSTQRLTTLNLNINPLKSDIKKYKSQFVGVGDRVILQSTSDIVGLDSPTAIELRAPEIVIGSSKNKEGILHSRQVIDAILTLRSMIMFGLKGPSGKSIRLSDFGQELSDEVFDLVERMQSETILIDTADN